MTDCEPKLVSFGNGSHRGTTLKLIEGYDCRVAAQAPMVEWWNKSKGGHQNECTSPELHKRSLGSPS